MRQRVVTYSFLTLIIDQILKIIITGNYLLGQGIKITDFLKIIYIRNYGAAWGILQGNRIFLIITALITIFLIFNIFLKNDKISYIEEISFGILIGGIIGNLTDRIIRGYVIDYISVIDFPVFNLADAAIVIGIILLGISLLGSEKNDNSRRK